MPENNVPPYISCNTVISDKYSQYVKLTTVKHKCYAKISMQYILNTILGKQKTLLGLQQKAHDKMESFLAHNSMRSGYLLNQQSLYCYCTTVFRGCSVQ